jgi:hypothetical protein
MKFTLIIIGSVLAGFALIGGTLYLLPKYSVYSARMEGEAILAKAESAKMAQIKDAEAKYLSAKYLKQAADEIESSLTPAYIDYLRIQMQEQVGEHNSNAVYFIPSNTAVVAPTK